MRLENSAVRIEVLPRYGGKLTSIYDKEKKFELLFQNPKSSWTPAGPHSCFADHEACGFDDLFPCVDEETLTYEGKKLYYPDHGYIWSSSLEVTDRTPESLTLRLEDPKLPFTFEKRVTLNPRGVSLHYRIRNVSDHPYPGFYTFHCLVDGSRRCELLAPAQVKQAVITCPSSRFPEPGSVVNYPRAGKDTDLSVPGQLADGECEKFYICGEVEQSGTGYRFPDENLNLIIGYDTEKLPYLGFWNTQGGFREDYNYAWEMSGGFYDSISCALEHNACPVIRPHGKTEFSITMDFKE